jgi:hypothetical protein
MGSSTNTWRRRSLRRLFDYLQRHLRILSGFYGILRPMDGVVPTGGDAGQAGSGRCRISIILGGPARRELIQEGDWILNLASEEYSRAVRRHLARIPSFSPAPSGNWLGADRGKRGVCQDGRGEMVRYLADGGSRPLRNCAPLTGWAIVTTRELSRLSGMSF